jgi:hypothetical protein
MRESSAANRRMRAALPPHLRKVCDLPGRTVSSGSLVRVLVMKGVLITEEAQSIMVNASPAEQDNVRTQLLPFFRGIPSFTTHKIRLESAAIFTF